MGVSIFAPGKEEHSLDLNHQNFHWLMTVLQLPYDHETMAMLPSEVIGAIRRFRAAYQQPVDRRVSPELMNSKISAWLALLQAKRSPAPVIQDVSATLAGCNVVSLEPDWSDLGDPFIPGSEAYELQEQLSMYITKLSQIASYCMRTQQTIQVF